MTVRRPTLAEALTRRASRDANFWSFGHQLGRRMHGHGIFQYPAMMVPDMVEALLATLQGFLPTDRPPRLLDPFAGSGPAPTAAMPLPFATRGAASQPPAPRACRAPTGPRQGESTRPADV